MNFDLPPLGTLPFFLVDKSQSFYETQIFFYYVLHDVCTFPKWRLEDFHNM